MSSSLITAGGLMTIAAVMGIGVFLIWVVMPLFGSASVDQSVAFPLPGSDRDTAPLLLELDEYRNVGMALWPDGDVVVFHARTGQMVRRERPLDGGRRITAMARSRQAGHVALGLDDGSVLLGQIGFQTHHLDASASEELYARCRDGPQIYGGGVAEVYATGQLRCIEAMIRLDDTVRISDCRSPLVRLDYRVQLEGQRIIREVMAGVTEEGSLHFATFRRQRNLLTGEERTAVRQVALPYSGQEDPPAFLLVNEQGSQLFLAWRSGALWRYDLRELDAPLLAEKTTLTRDGAQLTQLGFLIGTRSLIAGDSHGRVNIWFTAEADDRALHPDGRRLVLGHHLGRQGGAITSIAASPRNRCLLSADAAGNVVLRHGTSEQALARFATPAQSPVVTSLFAPKADALATLDSTGLLTIWELHNPHPETTFATLFGEVWYEGYAEPTCTWQSSSGSDDFEAKLSLIPLVFGTLKATVYSMFFAVPVALLGAIYTSQFLHPKYRNVIKPAVEIMASLPSVVLGFIGALVLAPVVERHLVASLALLAMLPLMIWLAGHFWQLLPAFLVVRTSGTRRLLSALVLMSATILISVQISPSLERMLFAGAVMDWLNGRIGTGAPLWGVLLFPVAFTLALYCRQRWLGPAAQRVAARHGAMFEKLAEFITTIALLSLSTGLTWVVAQGLTYLGFDLRGELAGTYVQRNTLIVGFVMGFAVIPIIYSIAEEALSAVPQHLRAGSLACGASPWQTTRYVVLPVAMSGIYSAVLIGLGRAVGETMIVVMAAGNTPILDVNPFNGLRALSANIAVELPEAVKGGTLYRVLFLSGLVLFFMTFLINTAAEIIRLRLRKRAYQL